MTIDSRNPASFRDPSGYVFEKDGQLFRYVDQSYFPDLDRLNQSGLLKRLFEQELLIRHETVNSTVPGTAEAQRLLKPERLRLISYPYEWSFGQLKDAALLTLKVLSESLDCGMILKDGSAFNVQFTGYKPVFIDTLSFATYHEGQPWLGYKQFCEHFLGPLCIAAFTNVEFQRMTRLGVDGIPLGLVSRLLPLRTWAKPATLLHVHLHARSIQQHSLRNSTRPTARQISRGNLHAMIQHLSEFIGALTVGGGSTQWGAYDEEVHYSDASKASKATIVKQMVSRTKAALAWDIGANDGFFSRLIANDQLLVLSLDSDANAIEKNYQQVKKTRNLNVNPLLFDITNPSPNLGWANEERTELSNRAMPDIIVALALIHHLVITNNIPFEKVAENFSRLAPWLIIEFIPAADEKIKPLPDTAGKQSYHRNAFELHFFAYYELVEEAKIQDSERTILLLKRK